MKYYGYCNLGNNGQLPRVSLSTLERVAWSGAPGGDKGGYQGMICNVVRARVYYGSTLNQVIHHQKLTSWIA